MRIFLILLIFSVVLNAHPDTDHMAQTICGLVEKTPEFNYADVFETSKYVPSKDSVSSDLKQAFDSHGPCVGIKKLSDIGQVTSYFVEYKDGFRSDLIIGMGSKAKIYKYFFGGELPPSNIVEMREWSAGL